MCITGSEYYGVNQVHELEEGVVVGVGVLHSTHGEDEAGDDDKEHDHVERGGIPHDLEDSLISLEANLIIEVFFLRRG